MHHRDKKNKHKRLCVWGESVGTFSIVGHAGESKVVFRGHISRTIALDPGRYVLELIATNSVGASSSTASLTFTIVG
jgi:hypothetical protein